MLMACKLTRWRRTLEPTPSFVTSSWNGMVSREKRSEVAYACGHCPSRSGRNLRPSAPTAINTSVVICYRRDRSKWHLDLQQYFFLWRVATNDGPVTTYGERRPSNVPAVSRQKG